MRERKREKRREGGGRERRWRTKDMRAQKSVLSAGDVHAQVHTHVLVMWEN
jgi:hypothetical protein